MIWGRARPVGTKNDPTVVKQKIGTHPPVVNHRKAGALPRRDETMLNWGPAPSGETKELEPCPTEAIKKYKCPAHVVKQKNWGRAPPC